MSNQTIIERAMLKQYQEKLEVEKAARGIAPSTKDIANKEGNKKIGIMYKIGLKSRKFFSNVI